MGFGAGVRISLYNFPNIQDMSCSQEMDGKLSPVGPIQSGNIHIFNIHFCCVGLFLIICVLFELRGAYTSKVPDAQVVEKTK